VFKRRAGNRARLVAALSKNTLQVSIGDRRCSLLQWSQELYRSFGEILLQLRVSLSGKMLLDCVSAFTGKQLIDSQEISNCRSRVVKLYFGTGVRHRSLELATHGFFIVQEHHTAMRVVI